MMENVVKNQMLAQSQMLRDLNFEVMESTDYLRLAKAYAKALEAFTSVGFNRSEALELIKMK